MQLAGTLRRRHLELRSLSDGIDTIQGAPRRLYERLSCPRSELENRIKELKDEIQMDRTVARGSKRIGREGTAEAGNAEIGP